MRNLFHSFRQFTIYLLPAFLVATAGVLLAALLYYPAPRTVPAPALESRVVIVNPSRLDAETDALLTAMLIKVLSQLQPEPELQARTLMYHRFESDMPTAEKPVMLRAPFPLLIEKDNDTLIRL